MITPNAMTEAETRAHIIECLERFTFLLESKYGVDAVEAAMSERMELMFEAMLGRMN